MQSITLTRSEKNPIISPISSSDHWWEGRSVFNPGAVVKDGKIYLLYRALGQVHYSSFGLAILTDPETVEKRFNQPVFESDEANPYEQFGVEDPRITYINGTYYIVYNAPSIYRGGQKKVNPWDHMTVPWRLRCSMASTVDLVTFNRHGGILPDIDSKDGVLFPEKINGQYVLLHRIYPNMWISFSDRIDKFPKGDALCSIREGKWDSERVGAGTAPIKTPLGWLNFYHGNEKYADGSFTYRLGILLLDLNDPKKILYRSNESIFEPEADYEKKGYVSDVVFSCGAVEWADKYYVYYGAADRVIGVANIEKQRLLDFLKENI